MVMSDKNTLPLGFAAIGYDL